MRAQRALVGTLALLLLSGACADERAPARTIQRGDATACASDARTIKNAEEAYFAVNNVYATEAALVPEYLTEESSLHDVALEDAGTAFELVSESARCGSVAP